MKHHVIGIDLGTTYSAVAAFDEDEDQALLFENPDGGEKTTPSVVGLHPETGKVVVGRQAKRNLAADPTNTIIEIKREMGEVFDQEKHLGRPGFESGKPVRVRFARSPDRWYLPQEISAFILMKMKEVAEFEIGTEVRDAVVTVPAYFHATQKKATEQAALMAGLYPRQLIPEPTAAAISFGLDQYDPERHVYLVYDLGGGTFDVSIIDIQADEIKVVATAGDPRLGGSDFDDAVTEWAVQEIQTQYGLDLATDPRARAVIRYEAEMAKIRLSSFEKTEMQLAELKPDVAPILEITRPAFEALIEDHLSRSMGAVEKALEYAEEQGCRREELSAILLVGGSSNIPAVRGRLMDYFGQSEDFVRADLDPASVVARGAAVLARRFAPTSHAYDIHRRPDATLVDLSDDDELAVSLINEHSLGVGVAGERIVGLIERGQNLPISHTKKDFVNPGPVEHVRAPVYQGESEYTYENTLIGEVVIGPMEPLPAGSHHFEVTFALDNSGLLLVTVHHLETGKEYQAQFEHDTTVEGDDALDALRGKLLSQYQPMSMTSAPSDSSRESPAQAATFTPPPPPGATPAAAPPEAEPGAPGEAAGAAAVERAPEETDQVDSPPVAEPMKDVPDQFKQTVRRSRKQLLKHDDDELREAFNAFMVALNEGAGEDDLMDLGDTLADALDDARHRAG